MFFDTSTYLLNPHPPEVSFPILPVSILILHGSLRLSAGYANAILCSSSANNKLASKEVASSARPFLGFKHRLGGIPVEVYRCRPEPSGNSKDALSADHVVFPARISSYCTVLAENVISNVRIVLSNRTGCRSTEQRA